MKTRVMRSIAVSMLCLVMAGCSSNADSEGYVYISDAKLTDDEAMVIMKAEVKSHCKESGLTCEVKSVEVDNNEIDGKYTYTSSKAECWSQCDTRGCKGEEG
jgi:hypothetical protein